MAFGGITFFLADVNDTYKLNWTETDFSSLDKISQTQTLTAQISNKTTVSGIQVDAESEVNVFKVAFGGVKQLTTDLPTLFVELITDAYNLANNKVGIPIVYLNGLIALGMAILIFGLIYSVVKIRI